MIKQFIKDFLLRNNMLLSRPPGRFNCEKWRFEQLKRRGLELKYVLDGGAAVGEWSREMMEVFPEAKFVAIEPRQSCQQGLKELARANANFTTVQTLIGDRVGTCEFNEYVDQSSILARSDGKEFGTKTSAPIRTIDSIVSSEGIPGFDLIKLDLQGYEKNALQGSLNTLKTTHLVLLELSFLQLHATQPVFAEMVAYMDNLGFQIYDILALWNRPVDQALAQGDFLFIHKSSPLVRNQSWS